MSAQPGWGDSGTAAKKAAGRPIHGSRLPFPAPFPMFQTTQNFPKIVLELELHLPHSEFKGFFHKENEVYYLLCFQYFTDKSFEFKILVSQGGGGGTSYVLRHPNRAVRSH